MPEGVRVERMLTVDFAVNYCFIAFNGGVLWVRGGKVLRFTNFDWTLVVIWFGALGFCIEGRRLRVSVFMLEGNEGWLGMLG